MAEDLLPSNASPFLKAMSLSQARILDVDMDVIRRSVLASISPASLLPWLAWDRSVDEYLDSWPVENRRAAVSGSFAYHKIKGTPGALKVALSSLGFVTEVSEWFQHGGNPYTFRVKATKRGGGSLTYPEFLALYRLILAAKNARSYLDAIETAAEYADLCPRIAAFGPSQTIHITIPGEEA